MIAVPFSGQLGNQLMQYCIGKIMAERTGQAYVPPKTWQNKAGKPVTWHHAPCLPPPTPTRGRTAPGPVQNISVDHWFDMDAINPNRSMRLDGYFQRYEFFAPWKDRIRNDWLKLQVPFLATDPDAVYVHVRRTDYLGDKLNPDRQCQATSLDDYANALREFPDAKRLVLVSDNYNDVMLDGFQKFGLPVDKAGGTWDHDFMLLASCRQIIMSQSTYAWWAAFLGQTQTIVCPILRTCYWGRGVYLKGKPAGNDYPNLFVYDEGDRWNWVLT